MFLIFLKIIFISNTLFFSHSTYFYNFFFKTNLKKLKIIKRCYLKIPYFFVFKNKKTKKGFLFAKCCFFVFLF